MSPKSGKFEEENALLFSKFEELNGRMAQSLNKVSSDAKKIVGLEFQLQSEKEKNKFLAEKLEKLQKDKFQLSQKLTYLNALEKQNFTITEKIAKIVTDIDSQEVREENWKDLIETLIGEIDKCISLLEE